MKPLLLAGVATLCFAASEPIVSLNSLQRVEASINDKVQSSVNDPYDLLGTARGTYIEGYGAIFSVEVNLVLSSLLNLNPFKPTITEAEIATMHERKVRKMEALRESMRGLMLSASKSLPGLPGNERIVMEAFLFNFRWENARGLPRRIMLTAEKQKLLDAANRHASGAELLSLFTEEEL
ncbi:MAG: hypothetical protein ABUS49_02590 [Acidobacteriota bacterium]